MPSPAGSFRQLVRTCPSLMGVWTWQTMNIPRGEIITISFLKDPPLFIRLSSCSGTMSTIEDIANGGSYCITLTWQDGSTTSNFLGTLVQSIGGYYIWLEEGIRSFVRRASPDGSLNPHFSFQNEYNTAWYLFLTWYLSSVGCQSAHFEDSAMPRWFQHASPLRRWQRDLFLYLLCHHNSKLKITSGLSERHRRVQKLLLRFRSSYHSLTECVWLLNACKFALCFGDRLLKTNEWGSEDLDWVMHVDHDWRKIFSLDASMPCSPTLYICRLPR